MAWLTCAGWAGGARTGSAGWGPATRPEVPAAASLSGLDAASPGTAGLWLLACLGAAAFIAVGALVGVWATPFLVGLAGGVASRLGGWRLRVALPAVVLVAAAGWGAALGWLALRGLPEGAVARVIAALAGLPARAAVAIAVTLLVAAIQAAVGLWLGRALTSAARLADGPGRRTAGRLEPQLVMGPGEQVTALDQGQGGPGGPFGGLRRRPPRPARRSRRRTRRRARWRWPPAPGRALSAEAWSSERAWTQVLRTSSMGRSAASISGWRSLSRPASYRTSNSGRCAAANRT